MRLGQSLKRTKLLQTFCSQAWFGAARAELPVSIIGLGAAPEVLGLGVRVSGSFSDIDTNFIPTGKIDIIQKIKSFSLSTLTVTGITGKSRVTVPEIEKTSLYLQS